jgi:hypothetical protein
MDQVEQALIGIQTLFVLRVSEVLYDGVGWDADRQTIDSRLV